MTKCKKHPRYQAKRQPRTTCRVCWEQFFEAESSREWQRLARHVAHEFRVEASER